jgi:hypothetical protein
MTRSAVAEAIQEIFETFYGPRESLSNGEIDFLDSVLRVAEAAIKDGVEDDAVWTICFFAITGPLNREQFERERPLVLQREAALKALKRINAGRSVTQDLRAQVLYVDKELSGRYPVKTHRYDEIDRRFKWKRGRARYIIEGPRKAKNKR